MVNLDSHRIGMEDHKISSYDVGKFVGLFLEKKKWHVDQGTQCRTLAPSMRSSAQQVRAQEKHRRIMGKPALTQTPFILACVCILFLADHLQKGDFSLCTV